MKRFKKMMAIAVVAVMTLATVIPMGVFADFGMDTKVSVTGLTAGDTVKYYQVLAWDQDNGTWKLADGFTSLSSETTTFPDSKGVVADIVNGIEQAQADKIASLASGASVKYTDSSITGTTSTYTLPDADSDGKPDLTAMGLYMAVVTAVTPGTVYNPVFVGADFDDSNTTNSADISSLKYGDTGIAKKSSVTVTKTTKDSDSAIAQAIDSYVGQDVDFVVDTTIPVFLDSYQNPSFVIDDAIKTSGIQYKAGSIKITLGEGSEAKAYAETATGTITTFASATDIFTSVVENSTTGYTVTFNPTYLKGLSVAVPVKIEYQGTITNTAEFNVNEDNNEVTVTYSNGPDEAAKAVKDRTNHYTFSLGAEVLTEDEDQGKTYELIKVGTDDNGKPVISKSEVASWYTKVERHSLAGATFGLYTDAECNTPYKNTFYPNGATFTTGADGIISFKGLAAGTYYIKEISAPSGYVKDGKIAKVVIEATYKNVTVPATTENGIDIAAYETQVLDKYTVKVNNVSVYNGDANTYGATQGTITNTYTFENNGAPSISYIAPQSTTVSDGALVNTKGVELPSTGGMGTTLFYIIGAILIIGAGVILVTRRRTESAE